MARAGSLPTPDEVMAGPDKGPTPVAPAYAMSRQDQLDNDHLNGPGFSIEDQKPGFFDNALGAPARGLGQAGADVYGVLAHGISKLFEPVDTPVVVGDGTVLPPATDAKDHPWHPAQDALEQQAKDAHEYSKSLMPNPRVTGAGANLIQGFTKGAAEFVGGSAAGGPFAGAALLGTAEGRASYLDLLDQGVDPETALKSASLTGALSGGAAFLPMALPAKMLAGLSTPAALLVQAGVGSTVNTAFGVGQRYASAKILEDAGYTAQAEQIKPWDSLNLATDFLTGSLFGIHSGWHGLKEERGEAAVADAARAVQDRQAALDRAPGVPVDTKSMATHAESLEKALSDLMQDKPVDLEDQAQEGGLFARPEEDTAEARRIIRDQFMDSGVMDEAADFDRWLRGEDLEPKPETKPATETLQPKESPVDPLAGDEHPDNDTINRLAREDEDAKGNVVSAQGPDVTAALRERPELRMPREMAESYHGSPYVFDAFDSEHIGSGEGAQVFGHGLYLADNKAIAEHYQKALTREHMSDDTPQGMAMRILESVKEPKYAAAELRERANASKDPDFSRKANEAARWIIEQDVGGRTPGKGGALYKVHIPKDAIEKMLDWDKPLSEQKDILKRLPASDRAKLEAMFKETGETLGDKTGKNLYEAIGNLKPDGAEGTYSEWASKYLLGKDVPGIRYLDNASRVEGATATDRNTVLFDQKLASIIERNGEPMASGILEHARDEEAQAKKEAEPMHKAAVDCEARYA